MKKDEFKIDYADSFSKLFPFSAISDIFFSKKFANKAVDIWCLEWVKKYLLKK